MGEENHQHNSNHNNNRHHYEAFTKQQRSASVMEELALLEAGPLADPVAHLAGLGRNSHGLNRRREA